MFQKKSCLVIGYGSIGQRHARLLSGLGHEVGIVTKRPANGFQAFPDVRTGLQSMDFDYVVVCNRTSEHFTAVKKLVDNGFKGVALVEKPLFERNFDLPPLPFELFVAYNLRFHPIVKKICDLIRGKTLYSMHVYCGQYLPTWRKRSGL